MDLPLEIFEEYKTNYDHIQDLSDNKNRENEVQVRLLSRKIKSLDLAKKCKARRFAREKEKLEKELKDLSHSAKSQASLRSDARVREIQEQSKRSRAALEQTRKDLRRRRNSSPVTTEERKTVTQGIQKRNSLSSKDVHDLRRGSLRTVGVLGGNDREGLSGLSTTGYHVACHMSVEDLREPISIRDRRQSTVSCKDTACTIDDNGVRRISSVREDNARKQKTGGRRVRTTNAKV